MTKPLTTEQNAVIISKLRDLVEYYRRTNELLGVLGFGTGMGCIGTDNPAFYALVSAVFLAIVWFYQTYSSNRRLALLRHIRHPEARLLRVWVRAWPALVGWTFLGLIAVGFLDKQGVNLKPNATLCMRAQAESAAIKQEGACAPLR